MTYIELNKEIVRKLGLQLCPDGEGFYGMKRGHPMVMKPLTAFPPSIMLKVRIDMSKFGSIYWPQSIDEIRSKGHLDLEFEGCYFWLTFYDTLELGLDCLLATIDAFFLALDAASVGLEVECASCGTSKNVQVVYSSMEVNLLCPACFATKREVAWGSEESLNKTNAGWSILLPLVLCAAAVSWVLFWTGYNELFQLLGTNEIVVPRFVILILMVVLSFAMAMPVGSLIKRSGINSLIPPVVAAPIFIVVAAILGEAALISFSIYLRYGVVDPLVSLNLLPAMLTDYSRSYLEVKGLFLVSLAYCCYEFSKRKKVAVEL